MYVSGTVEKSGDSSGESDFMTFVTFSNENSKMSFT